MATAIVRHDSKPLDEILLEFIEAFDEEFESARDEVENVEDMDPSVDFRVGICEEAGFSWIDIENFDPEKETDTLEQICEGVGATFEITK